MKIRVSQIIGLLCPVAGRKENRNAKDMSTGFMTLQETAKKCGIGARWNNTLCSEGRIPGAAKIGNMWVVPVDAKKPKDERIKSGRYVKDK